MQVVIDILDNYYNTIKENEYGIYEGRLYDIIRKGTPLPKGYELKMEQVEEFILKSVIEDIKAEIIQNRDRDIGGNGNVKDWLEGYRTGFNETLAIIDKYISEKENTTT